MTNLQVLTLVLEAISGIGCVVSLLLIWLRVEGLESLRAQGRNGDARYVSHADIRGEVLVLTVFVLYLVLAVVVHFTAFRGDPPFAAWEGWALEHAGEVLRVAIIGSATVLLIKQVWKVRDWEHLTGLSAPLVVADALQRHAASLARWVKRMRRRGNRDRT